MADNSTVAAPGEYPVEIVQKQFNSQYLYRLPENEELCYKFAILNKMKYHQTAQCTACFAIYRKKSRLKEHIKNAILRKMKNSSMESDPSVGHFEGCTPINYSETLIQYQAMADEEDENHTFRFPLVKIGKNNTFVIVHRPKENPSNCYRLLYHRKNGSHITVRCSPCSTIQRQTKCTTVFYNMTTDGFLEDPSLHHSAGCDPFVYDELLLDYNPLGVEKSRQTIRSWICKDEKGMKSEDPAKHSEISQLIRSPSGVRIVETINNASFIYRIPDSDKCLKFIIQRYGMNKTVSVACAQCNRIYVNALAKKGIRGEFHVTTRMTDGFSMEEDPLLNHCTGCEPVSYSETMKNYKDVSEKEIRSAPQFDYPLIKVRKMGERLAVYQMENDPTKCILFFARHKSKNAYVSVICFNCDKLMKNKGGNRGNGLKRFRLNESGFLDDPSSGHLPKCQQLCMMEAMKKREFVDENTAKTFLNGTMGRCEIFDTQLHSRTGFTTLTDFPAVVIQKRHALQLIYRMPNRPTHAYVFHQLNHKDCSELICSTCKFHQGSNPKSVTIIRNSDGISIEGDPTKNHLPLCDGRVYKKLWLLKHVHREDGTKNPQRTYQFPLETRQTREKSSIMYRLKNDPTKCYRFNSVFYASASGILHVGCISCALVREKNVKNSRKQENARNAVLYQCSESGFVDDPSQQHVLGCEPLEYDKLMNEYAIIEGQEARNYLKHIYTAATTHGINVPTKSSNPKNVSHNVEQKIADRFSPRTSMESDQEKEADKNQSECSRDICIEETKIFSRVYDVPFFTKDEVNVKVDDRTIIIEFRREVSAAGVEGCFLRYLVNLPPSVDISTVQTTWNQGQITLTAERTE